MKRVHCTSSPEPGEMWEEARTYGNRQMAGENGRFQDEDRTDV
jgi:hypothetical protein